MTKIIERERAREIDKTYNKYERKSCYKFMVEISFLKTILDFILVIVVSKESKKYIMKKV